MQPLIDDLCEYVASLTSLDFGSGDTELKSGEMPLNEDGIYAINAPSDAPNIDLPIMNATIDFWARYSNTTTAYTKLQEVYDALDRKHNFETTNYYVFFCYPAGSIEDLDRDSAGGKLLRLSVILIYRNLNAIS